MLRVETSGKSVEEALAKALQQLGLDRTQVDVEVVSEGRGGIFGVGAQQARIIVTPRPGVMATGRPAPAVDAAPDEDEDEEEQPQPAAPPPPVSRPAPQPRPSGPPRGGGPPPRSGQPRGPRPPRPPMAPARQIERRPVTRPTSDPDDPVAVAEEILHELLSRLGFEAEVTARPAETPGDGTVAAVLDVHGDGLQLLIGRRGETLASLQYLVNLLMNQYITAHTTVGIDIDGYRRRREESLINLAQRMAERVSANGQSITLEPMPPNERRIIHLTLADHPDVLTVSIGEGDARKVAITPRR